MNHYEAPASTMRDLAAPRERIGPYTVYDRIGAGGMGSVHLALWRPSTGVSRIVALKRLHPRLVRGREFVGMFLREVRLAGRVKHPNVVGAIDWVSEGGRVALIMDYVHGVSLHTLLRQTGSVPLPIGSAIVVGAALGLHAAHEAVDRTGRSLGIVHRDVSPHNVLLGVDGLPRVIDFGVAKAASAVAQASSGWIKGKIGYMAPEQLRGEGVDRRADVYSLGVVLWELATGCRLFPGSGNLAMLNRASTSAVESPRRVNRRVSPELEGVIMKSLASQPEERYQTALELAEAVERTVAPVGQHEVGRWVSLVAKDALDGLSAARAQVDLDCEAFDNAGLDEETMRGLSAADATTAGHRRVDLAAPAPHEPALGPPAPETTAVSEVAPIRRLARGRLAVWGAGALLGFLSLVAGLSAERAVAARRMHGTPISERRPSVDVAAPPSPAPHDGAPTERPNDLLLTSTPGTLRPAAPWATSAPDAAQDRASPRARTERPRKPRPNVTARVHPEVDLGY